MIYKYALYGRIQNTDRTISYFESNPLGIRNEDLWKRVFAFSKAFQLIKLDLN